MVIVGAPKGEQEAEHDGMTHIAIEAGDSEANRGVRTPGGIEIDLTEPEQAKWSIKNVDTSTIAQPAQKTAGGASDQPARDVPDNSRIGRHYQKRRPRVRLLTRTKVLRSTGGGTNRVHHR